MRQHRKRETVTAEEMSYSNMLTVNALVELLDEQGVHRQDSIGSKSFHYSRR